MPSHAIPELMTAQDAAGFLDVSVVTIARLARSGELQSAHKLPGLRGARLFHRDEVTRVAAERNLSS